jgi:Sugar-specific transcriptional regulator TrmB.
MKIVQPTDFDILNALSETGGRNVAANIARELDRDRSYINTRFSKLVEYGLVERVGPADRSGLYDLTARGERALQHRNQYDSVDDFESLISKDNMSATDDDGSE